MPLDLLPVGLDSPAMRMAEHDDVRHLERKRREFDRGTGAVISTLRLVRRHEVRDVAQDEQGARLGVEDRRHVDPGIAAGNDHGGRRLAELGKLKVAPAGFGMNLAAGVGKARRTGLWVMAK